MSKGTSDLELATVLSTKAALNNNTVSLTLNMSVSFPVYLMSFSAFVGYWLFVLFGGVGLTALPLDLFSKFSSRPLSLTTAQATRKKLALRNLNLELVQVGKLLKEE